MHRTVFLTSVDVVHLHGGVPQEQAVASQAKDSPKSCQRRPVPRKTPVQNRTFKVFVTISSSSGTCLNFRFLRRVFNACPKGTVLPVSLPPPASGDTVSASCSLRRNLQMTCQDGSGKTSVRFLPTSWGERVGGPQATQTWQQVFEHRRSLLLCLCFSSRF